MARNAYNMKELVDIQMKISEWLGITMILNISLVNIIVDCII